MYDTGIDYALEPEYDDGLAGFYDYGKKQQCFSCLEYMEFTFTRASSDGLFKFVYH